MRAFCLYEHRYSDFVRQMDKPCLAATAEAI